MFDGVTHTQDTAFEAGALSCLHHSHSVVVCSQRVLSHFKTVKIKWITGVPGVKISAKGI